MPPLVRREGPPSNSGWKVEKCKVQMCDNTWQNIRVFRHGDLTVHLLPKDDRADQAGAKWGLSHYHTGLLILWTRQEIDAKRIGEFLWLMQKDAFREEETHRVTRKLAGWVVPWVRECRRQLKWVDPSLFLQEEGAK